MSLPRAGALGRDGEEIHGNGEGPAQAPAAGGAFCDPDGEAANCREGRTGPSKIPSAGDIFAVGTWTNGVGIGVDVRTGVGVEVDFGVAVAVGAGVDVDPRGGGAVGSGVGVTIAIDDGDSRGTGVVVDPGSDQSPTLSPLANVACNRVWPCSLITGPSNFPRAILPV